MSPEGKTLLNIIILGLGFMVMFTAFGTCGNIEVGFELFHTLEIHDLMNVITSALARLIRVYSNHHFHFFSKP